MAKVNANLDEMLIAGLAVAKKRPPYYLLVVKSSDVVGMIVQKKKIKDKKAQDAKKEYKGTDWRGGKPSRFVGTHKKLGVVQEYAGT